MDALLARSDRLASELLDFAFASPHGPALKHGPRQGVAARTVRWPPQLDLALTFACLIDLAGAERLSIDASGSLFVSDVTSTGSPAHDLLLRRVAEAGGGCPPHRWVWRLRREVASAVLADAVGNGDLSVGGRPRHPGPAEHVPTDRAGADELHVEVRRVMLGESQDPRATALFVLCVATPLRELLPARRESGLLHWLGRTEVGRQVAYQLGVAAAGPRRAWLHRSIEQLPPSAVADAFGPGAARVGISTMGDVIALIPQVSWGPGGVSG
jgi:hypothetical protein